MNSSLSHSSAASPNTEKAAFDFGQLTNLIICFVKSPQMGTFRPGNIKKIALKNFQIFEDQTFNFGPSLNLIAAPNGSGKSAVANGIALLFGSHRVTGSSRNPGDFVRFGSKEAVISAEVFKSTSEHLVFERRITLISDSLESKSFFLVGGSLCHQKVFQRQVAELGINVSNLCNFLPQERVAEFCQLEPSALLRGVLASSAREEIALDEIHRQEEEIKRIDEQIDSHSKKRDMLSNAMNYMQADLEKENEKQELKNKLVNLEYKHEYLLYEQAKDAYLKARSALQEELKRLEELKTERKSKEKELEALEDLPVLKKYREGLAILHAQNKNLKECKELLEENAKNLDSARSNLDSLAKRKEADRVENERARSEVESQEECLRKVSEHLECIISKFVHKLKNIAKQITSDQNTAEQSADNPSTESQSAALAGTLDTLFDKSSQAALSNSFEEGIDSIMKIIDSKASWDEKIKRIDSSINALLSRPYNDNGIKQQQFVSQQIKKSIDELEAKEELYSKRDAQRLELLKRYHGDTYKAVMWLRANKPAFNSEVLEPAFLHIEIHPEYQAELETLLGFQALSSFLVSNYEDFVLLTRLLKEEQRFSINVAEISAGSVPVPLKKDILEVYGFDGVASDFITARPEYIRFFNIYGYFSSIPITKKEVNEVAFFREVTACKRMVVAGRYAEIKRSRYDKEFIVVSAPAVSKGLFKPPGIEIKDVKKQLEELKMEREAVRKRLETLYEERASHEKSCETLKKRLDLTDARKEAYKISQIKERLRELRSIDTERYDGRIKAIEAECTLYSERIDKHVLEIHKILTDIPTIDAAEAHSKQLDAENLRREIVYTTHRIERSKFQKIEEEKEAAKLRVISCKNKIRQMLSENAWLDPKIPDTIPDTIAKGSAGVESEEKVISDLESEIKFLKAKIELLPENNKTYEEFMAKEAQASAITETLEEMQKRKESSILEYEILKERVSSALKEILVPLNMCFSSLFGRFGASGRLELSLEGRWGLHIYVSFREGVEQERLDGFRQSGGERSLTTALFLLTLQRCGTVPFRLVDEINQGMDAANEQLVFEIIKEMSLSSQFFIITPKLIPDISFPDSATVSIIYSGQGMPSNISEYLNNV